MKHPEEKQASRKQGIRAWYETTTKRARLILFLLATLAFGGVLVFFSLAPDSLTAKLQTLNGAWTIPAFGGLWLVSFIYLWLLPMREVSFRGQEAMERMEERLADFLEKEAGPAMLGWKRLGERLEGRLTEELLDRLAEYVELNGPPPPPPPPAGETKFTITSKSRNGVPVRKDVERSEA